MSAATAMASDLASDLSERFEHAGDKIRKLELVTRPARKQARKDAKKQHGKKRSKLGMLTMLTIVGGVIYAAYKMLREDSTTEPMTSTGRETHESDADASTPKQTVRSA